MTPNLTIRLFRTPRLALEHFCDHVLTLPEARVWFLLLARFRQIGLAPETDVLIEYARKLWSKGMPSTAQGFFETYEDKVEESMNEARRQEWLWQDADHCWRGVDGLGVYVVWNDESKVLTGMVVALAAPKPSAWVSPEERTANPLRRMNTRRWSKYVTYPGAPPHDRVFYDCFVEAMRRLRQEHKFNALNSRVQTRLPSPAYQSVTFQQWLASKVHKPQPAAVT